MASVVFELFLWCTLAFIVYQRRISAVIVFGYGYGAYLLGSENTNTTARSFQNDRGSADRVTTRPLTGTVSSL